MSYEVPTPIFQDMQINKGKYFGVQVNDVLAYQSDMDLMNMFTEDAAKQLKIAIENEVFFNSFVTEGPDSANEGGTAGEISAAYNLVLTPLLLMSLLLTMSLTRFFAWLLFSTSRTSQKMAVGWSCHLSSVTCLCSQTLLKPTSWVMRQALSVLARSARWIVSLYTYLTCFQRCSC